MEQKSNKFFVYIILMIRESMRIHIPETSAQNAKRCPMAGKNMVY